ncbi:Hypothetical predicted protein [Octopus vulgaris]|uniref:Uncharacterized protein n=1 Tax=Octopus vulgaris TaxID=6645 RepID=A0AA36FLU1_OCTVU|nr:Hypothetical predicted protein [Octopus vulgaris]
MPSIQLETIMDLNDRVDNLLQGNNLWGSVCEERRQENSEQWQQETSTSNNRLYQQTYSLTNTSIYM